MGKQKRPNVIYVYKAELLRVVDGDTIECLVDRAFKDKSEMDVRILRADAPETKGIERAAGEWVTQRVIDWIGGRTELILMSHKVRSSFSRYLFDVWCGDENLSDWLLERGYAWPTDERGKVIGPRDVTRLNLPEGIKQQVRERMA